MAKRIFRAVCLISLWVFAASVVIIMWVLYDYYSETQRTQLKRQTNQVAEGVELCGMEYLTRLSAEDYRITYIDGDGTVLYDNKSDAAKLENHKDREEVAQAYETGYGESARFSEILTQRQIYAAKRLSEGRVIRLSDTQYTVFTLFMSMMQPILIVALITIVAALILSYRVSARIVKPLNDPDLKGNLTKNGYKELAPLLNRMENQQRQISFHTAELKRKQLEFEAATKNMKEGLILLNPQGVILSMNRSAANFLKAGKYTVGKDIHTLQNTEKLTELLRQSLQGVHAETIWEMGDSSYQCNASPVIAEGEVTAVAFLLFDVTEKEKAEQMRREFTANVSHELKTPLHSISGCAELLCNGMVKQQDVPQFFRQIYTEAQRMIRLVDDIIRLSQLDEGDESLQKESIELYALAEETKESLQKAAEKAHITVLLTGEPVSIQGIRQQVSGIVYNLCDNAIKYNHENGHVWINVKKEGNEAVLVVEDDGIGIPPEHQERIFERFYRVDKSHSKEVGGTGLGLSIVKHAVRQQNGKIELKSEVGKGTRINVRFYIDFTNT